MIFGNPYVFAILIQDVPQWGDGSFRNGVFQYIVDGRLFPEIITTSTLNVDVESLRVNNSFISLPENCEIFNDSKNSAFRTMLEFIWPDFFDEKKYIPDGFEPKYIYKVSTPNIEDSGNYVFCVACGDQVRILAAKAELLKPVSSGKWSWERQHDFNVCDVIIPRGEIKKIINDVVDFYSKLE